MECYIGKIQGKFDYIYDPSKKKIINYIEDGLLICWIVNNEENNHLINTGIKREIKARKFEDLWSKCQEIKSNAKLLKNSEDEAINLFEKLIFKEERKLKLVE